MFLETMMRTIPVAMMAIEVLWTERFQRFRDVRKSPPDRMWNAIHIAASETTIPSSRVSSSVDDNVVRHDRVGGGVPPVSADALGTSTVVMQIPPATRPQSRTYPRPRVRTGVRRTALLDEDQPQTETEPAVTPLQTLSFVVQPASITTLRLSLVIGCGFRRIVDNELPPGVWNGAVPWTFEGSGLAHSAMADSPADLPSSRASFHTETV